MSNNFLYSCKDEAELSQLKDRATKCKVICLSQMGKHPLSNPSYMKLKEKNELLKSVKSWLDGKSDDEIDQVFNEVCLSTLFDGEKDVSQYPVYHRNEDGDQEKENIET